MALSLATCPAHVAPVFDHAKRPANVRSDVPSPRPRAAEHSLLALQRTAGNAAVAGLFGHPTVQRFWPFDDDEDEGEEEGPAAEEEEEEDEEEVPKSPSEQIPNDSDDALPDPTVVVTWSAEVGPGYLQVEPESHDRGAMVEATRARVTEWATSLPYEPIPASWWEGNKDRQASMMVSANATEMLTPYRWVVGEQAFRAWAGLPSPDIERVVGGPGGGGGPGAPGGGPAPGGGSVPGRAPGGIPGMEPVTPGGGQAPGGSTPGIPGMEPVTPGGGGAAPGGIPGMEPVSPGGGPAGPASARPMLQKGSTGDAVREMQELLVRRGAAIDPDGQFGSATQRAVIAFQRSETLGADGIVGPLTWKALGAD